MNWKEGWRLTPSDRKKLCITSFLLAGLILLAIWSNEQNYTSPAMKMASFVFFEAVCIATVVNGIYFNMKLRKQTGRFWNPVTTVAVLAAIIIIFIVFILSRF